MKIKSVQICFKSNLISLSSDFSSVNIHFTFNRCSRSISLLHFSSYFSCFTQLSLIISWSRVTDTGWNKNDVTPCQNFNYLFVMIDVTYSDTTGNDISFRITGTPVLQLSEAFVISRESMSFYGMPPCPIITSPDCLGSLISWQLER